MNDAARQLDDELSRLITAITNVRMSLRCMERDRPAQPPQPAWLDLPEHTGPHWMWCHYLCSKPRLAVVYEIDGNYARYTAVDPSGEGSGKAGLLKHEAKWLPLDVPATPDEETT